MSELIKQLSQGLIVSCQALEDEPLYGADIMAAMALAAQQGGARAIRANSPEDIAMIKKKCSLPVIGLYKKSYPDCPVYITPTMAEVDAVVRSGADIVALDATMLERPDGVTAEQLIAAVRDRFPGMPILADVSTYDEGVHAMELGVELVSTTLSGYTPYSRQQDGPDLELVEKLANLKRTPVIAEGKIWTPQECVRCFGAGAYAVVVGTAITRPREITKRFLDQIDTERIRILRSG
ncbi:N-acetylmannosamine-6-phosphate 2-epimerase [Paenibacillus sp.]|uniref:N-acetylmannosamine-6-phosphate 2-epimerase n=1 Tax=Paenibacillus sp. TaxID=58172 RepID=UPI002811BB2D|nr:N-acetylmannosamine-6-phosphate 2-epimerase [Paenibacillus sp.]